MNENKIKSVFGKHDADKESIRKSVIEKAEQVETKKHGFARIKPILYACISLLIVAGCLSGYMLTVDAKEYREAVEFFDEYGIETEGLSRTEIKAVYKDITMKTYSYEKTAELFNKLSVEMFNTTLESTDKASLEALWNRRNSGFYIDIKNESGIHYSVVYEQISAGDKDNAPIDRAVIICLDGETEKWRYVLPYDMYVFEGENLLPCENGLIVYGSKDFCGANSGNACAFMLDASGALLWEYEDVKASTEIETAALYKNKIALFGKRDEYSSSGDATGRIYFRTFTVLYTDGKLVYKNEEKSDVNFRQETAAQIGDYYLVKQFICGENYEWTPELVSVSEEGMLTNKFTYSEGGVTYKIQDIISLDGKVYLSALLPKTDDNEFEKEFNSLEREFLAYWEKTGKETGMPASYDEKMNKLFETQYSAALLICDGDAVIKKAYSVDNARAGTLEVNENGMLSWLVIRVDKVCNVSPVISSRRVDINSTAFSFVFDGEGKLTEKTELGTYMIWY